MRLWSNSFRDGGLISTDHAFAQIDPVARVRAGVNRNPHLAWDDVPNGTESLALFCIDLDAPQSGADVNQAGRVLPMSLLRGEFFHWSLLDLPPTMDNIGEGQFSSGITARGKAVATVEISAPGAGRDGAGPGLALRQGLNDFTGWFAADAAMAGDYYGYDGPCPPWNDERIHHYVFRLVALDTPRLALPARFSGLDARAAMHGHILEEAQVLGAYSLYPATARTLQR